MINQPSLEVRQRLRAMCAEMAVTQHLGDEIQHELYGHMEDKLLAYLNGEEAVTEEDALILVREHFGDPAVVKKLLCAVNTTAQTQKAMLIQGGAFILSWVAQMYLTMTYPTPPVLPVLIASLVIALVLGMLSVGSIPYRDRFSKDPKSLAVYRSFQFLCVTPSLTIIPLASGIYRAFYPVSEGRTHQYGLIISVLLALYMFSVLALVWNLLRWRIFRKSET